jgi:excisionase family DNA binding protein
MTRREVADLLRVSVETVDRWRRRGRLPGVQVVAGRGAVRFRAEDVEALLEPEAPEENGREL